MRALTLHSGAKPISFDDLKQVETPHATDTWHPIPHTTLFDEVTRALGSGGYHIVSEEHGLTPDNARYFGVLELRNGHNSDEFALVVGIRNSHDKKFPASLAVGASVFVCDNLSFSGEVTVGRRHTLHIMRDLPVLVNAAVGKLGTLREKQQARFDAYKQKPVSTMELHDILFRSHIDCGVPITKLGKVRREFMSPRHEEFKGRTVWTLQNAFTEELKGSNIENLPRQTQALHGLFDTFCELDLATR